MLKLNDVTIFHDQKQKRIADMPKVISPITLHEKINQPKTTCSLMSAKKDPIVNMFAKAEVY